jgi:transposase
MRQTYLAGDKLFVDWAGDKVPIIDPMTGEVHEAHLFIAALGASSYTYAEARWSETLPDWIGAHVNALDFLGGVPKAAVPDNLKAGITKPSRYEPGVNRTYQDLADHYGFVVLPARVRRPRDKTSVSYCTSFGLSGGDTIQPCWTRAAPTMALDDLQAWRDVPKPTSKAV